MKKKLFFAIASVCLLCLAGCVKSDDFDALSHEIELRGEFHPTLGFPVGSCSMNMGELLGIWQTTLCKIEFDENDLLVIKYDTTINGTFKFTEQNATKKGVKTDGDSFTISKSFSGDMPVDLFNNIQSLDHIDFDDVYLTMSAFIKGHSKNPNILGMLDRFNINVDLDNIKIDIMGANNSQTININPMSINELMSGENITLVSPDDPESDLGDLLTMRPNKIHYSMDMNVHFSSATLTALIAAGITTPEAYVNDSITLDSISASTSISANFPLKVQGYVDYNMQMDLPFDGVEEALGVLRDKVDFGDSSYLALRFVNSIPMEFTMTDTLTDQQGIIITNNGQPYHLYNPSTAIKSATTKDITINGVTYTVSDTPTETIMKVPINESNLNVLLKARKMRLGIHISTSNLSHISVRECDKLQSSLYVVINPENEHISTK